MADATTTPALTRCRVCNGLGHHRCDCWPGDCICGIGDEKTCDECRGDGWVEPSYDDWEDIPDA